MLITQRIHGRVLICVSAGEVMTLYSCSSYLPEFFLPMLQGLIGGVEGGSISARLTMGVWFDQGEGPEDEAAKGFMKGSLSGPEVSRSSHWHAAEALWVRENFITDFSGTRFER
jgi:hypothetical protein